MKRQLPLLLSVFFYTSVAYAQMEVPVDRCTGSAYIIKPLWKITCHDLNEAVYQVNGESCCDGRIPENEFALSTKY